MAKAARSWMERDMTAKTPILAALALAALTGSAALAERMPMMGEGMMGGPEGAFDFAAVDADKDGKITRAEMDAHRAAEVTAVDADRDGKLSATELQAMILARMTARATAMATAMMTGMDQDGDGLLTAAELAVRPGPAMLFDRADADGDGAVTEAEIAALRDDMGGHMGGGDGEGRGHHGRGGHGWFGFGGDE